MTVLVLKTKINTKEELNYVGRLLNNLTQIKKWSVDLEDIDKVLRIEVVGKLTELNIIDLLNRKQLLCEELF